MNYVYFYYFLFVLSLIFCSKAAAECCVGDRERNSAMGLLNLLQTGEKYACRTRKSDLFYLLVAIEVEKPLVVPLIFGKQGANVGS